MKGENDLKRILLFFVLISLCLTSCKMGEKQKDMGEGSKLNVADSARIEDVEYGLRMPPVKEILEQLRYNVCLQKYRFQTDLYRSFYDRYHDISVYYQERDYAQDSKAYQIVYVVKGGKECEYYTVVYTCKGFLSYIENVGSGADDVKSVNDCLGGEFSYYGEGKLCITREETEDFVPNFQDAYKDKSVIEEIKKAVKKEMRNRYGLKRCEIDMMFLLPADCETKVYVKDDKKNYYEGDLKLLYSGKKLDHFEGVLYEKVSGPTRIGKEDEIAIQKSLQLEEIKKGDAQKERKNVDRSRDSSNKAILYDSFVQSRDYKRLQQFDFSPCQALEEEIEKFKENITVEAVNDLTFVDCNITGNNKDIITVASVETDAGNLDILLLFLDRKQKAAFDILSPEKTLNYQIADLNHDGRSELIADFFGFKESRKYIGIYHYKGKIVPIFEENIDSFQYDFSYTISGSKITIKRVKYYYNKSDEQKKAKIVKYVYGIKKDSMVLVSKKTLWKSKLKDFKAWTLG